MLLDDKYFSPNHDNTYLDYYLNKIYIYNIFVTIL